MSSSTTMDFFTLKTRYSKKDNRVEVYPEFIVEESKDLMVRGTKFYAFWDQDKNIWCTERLKIRKKIDNIINSKAEELRAKEKAKKESDKDYTEKDICPLLLKDFSTNLWTKFIKYVESIKDSYHQLDTKLTFADSKIEKEDYVSKQLKYSVVDGDYSAWDKLVSTLYDPEEREKIEWAIGAILSGDSKKIQKFFVFYGEQGSGKSTILNIIMKLFDGYYVTFKAENLVKGTDQFNLDFLADNPLVAIDADANLNKIETNATMNKLVSHERLQVNEKFKDRYPVDPLCMLMLATNSYVKITNAKSGIIRRLIDIEPSHRKIPEDKYFELMDQVNFELGAIAFHCLEVYKKLGRSYYSSYIPERMMYRTDPFYNFMDELKDTILEKFPYGITGEELWRMWKEYCQESGVEFTRKRYEIVDEAKNYFTDCIASTSRQGSSVHNLFVGLKPDKFDHQISTKLKKKINKVVEEDKSINKEESKDSEEVTGYSSGWLKLEKIESLFDKEFADCPAQYAVGKNAIPNYSWERVKTKLSSIDTSETHYVKTPGNLIFIDFDVHKQDSGEKDTEANVKLAGSSKWKETYAELSKGGGVHLYYWYDGDVTKLSSQFDVDIEVKVYPESSKTAPRRKLTYCNDKPIAHLSSGLPFKETKMINWDGLKDDKHLRNIIKQAIKKEVRPYGEDPKTITCVKFIADMLKNAQDAGISYNLMDLDNTIYSFAASSHHNKDECLRIYYNDIQLVWPKEETSESNVDENIPYEEEAPIIILDCEVTKNLILVVYKELEPDGIAAINKSPDVVQNKCVRLFNPKPHEISPLLKMRIVGHNVIDYDNHILYAIMLGYSPEQICNISQKIIAKDKDAKFPQSKSISYTDTLDVASEKKGLKKIEIEMHIPHKEMEIDWTKPIPESEWERLAQYCENDVLATEAYYLSKKWQADFKARKMLAALTGMTVNDSTNNLSAQLIFGNVKEPWHEFIYPDLKKMFPEYRFENGKSYYGDELIGEGGRVYAEPGMYYDTVTFDVASMHPTSIISENGFGPYTQRYKDLYEARIAIKHKDYDKARSLFDGRLAPYLTSDEDADDLAYALKIVLNSAYGMTAANFQNRFRDPRNKDNWVAKRGALFMEKLRREVQARKGHVIHIKTDSIKLVKPSKEIQDFVIEFGKKYGYTFEIESKYERICLVNHAVYIALRQKDDPGWLKECKKAKEKAEKDGSKYIEPTRWTATGAQFAHPYVFKRLFSREPMTFWDFCETKTVKTTMYLDLNENLEDVTAHEKEKKKIETRIKKLKKDYLTVGKSDQEKIDEEIKDLQKDISVLDELIAKGHAYTFVGKAGEFVPVKPGLGGGLLMRQESSGGYGYVTKTKGYRWLESENLHQLKDWKNYIDIRYFRGLIDDSIAAIGQYGDFELFVKGDPEESEQILDYNVDPWMLPCGNEKYAYCSDCPEFSNDDNTYGYCCKLGYNIENQILGEK